MSVYLTFADGNGVTFDTSASAVFEVSAETRTVKGLMVPFGVIGDNGYGAYRFGKGTLALPSDLSRVKLLVGHDFSKAVGYLETAEETDQGLIGSFKVDASPEGDQALVKAQGKVWDGLSVGLGRAARFKESEDGVLDAISAPVIETSLTPLPAFDDARVTSVAASAAHMKNEEDPAMGEENTQTAESATDFSAVVDAVKDGITEAFTSVDFGRPEVISAGAGAQVADAPVYRFNAAGGEYEFSTDIFNAIRFNDSEAKQRLDSFMVQFAATATDDVTGLNPNGYRPDLYVDAAVAATPVYNALYKGGLTDSTPFVVPKFGSASGLVSDHVEGVEPAEGTFTATSQTVTPSAVSGEAKITREVIDAGGNPQVSGLIWTQIQRAYAAAMETKAAALLNGGTFTELGTAPASGDTGASLFGKVVANLALVPFIDGGDYFTEFLGHVDLYTLLAGANDSSGRPLAPQIAPQNSDGSAANRFASLNVGGWAMTPAKSLGATGVNKKSYLFDPQFGGVWASAPLRIALPETVATAGNIGVFGYVATAVLDASKVRKVTR